MEQEKNEVTLKSKESFYKKNRSLLFMIVYLVVVSLFATVGKEQAVLALVVGMVFGFTAKEIDYQRTTIKVQNFNVSAELLKHYETRVEEEHEPAG